MDLKCQMIVIKLNLIKGEKESVIVTNWYSNAQTHAYCIQEIERKN